MENTTQSFTNQTNQDFAKNKNKNKQTNKQKKRCCREQSKTSIQRLHASGVGMETATTFLDGNLSAHEQPQLILCHPNSRRLQQGGTRSIGKTLEQNSSLWCYL